MRPKQNDSIDVLYPAEHMPVYRSDVTLVVLSLSRPFRPRSRYPLAGWYSVHHVFLFSGASATFFIDRSFFLCVPLQQHFLPSAFMTVGTRIHPYERYHTLDHQ